MILFNNWIILSIIGTIITSISLIFIKIVSDSKYDNDLILASTFCIMGLLSLLYIIFNKRKDIFFKECNHKILLFILVFAIILLTSKIVVSQAIKYTPNVSYVHMIINLNIILTVIMGYYIFKQTINIKCFIGILLALLGISIVIFNREK